jgi:hypothetical protein
MLFTDNQIFLVKFIEYLQISLHKLNYTIANVYTQISTEKKEL